MDTLGQRQVAFNASSRDQWEGFSEHRRCLTALLARRATKERSRLCVLGAGNANDLDLTTLLAAHSEVHLVDIDAEALNRGVERQGVARHPRLWLHGGVDVTGTLGLLSDLTPISEMGPSDFDAMAQWPASRAGLVLPRQFDLVASTCLLTQILETAAHALGKSHPQLSEAQAALRAGHVRLMASLAAAAGEAVLVTEVVSSRTFPELPAVNHESLARLLPGLGRASNHFRAVHPRELLSAVRTDPALGPRVTVDGAFKPWRWQLHDQIFLVVAIGFRLMPG